MAKLHAVTREERRMLRDLKAVLEKMYLLGFRLRTHYLKDEINSLVRPFSDAERRVIVLVGDAGRRGITRADLPSGKSRLRAFHRLRNLRLLFKNKGWVDSRNGIVYILNERGRAIYREAKSNGSRS